MNAFVKFLVGFFIGTLLGLLLMALFGAACYQVDGVQHSFSIGVAENLRPLGNHCFDK